MSESDAMISVAVIMGGVSTEREISLKSGVNVCNSLPRGRFRVRPVVIEADGSWRVGGWLTGDQQFEEMDEAAPRLDALAAVAQLREEGLGAVFIALHGPGGEDGVIQGFFETLGVPHTGSGVLGNAAGMDKALTKRVLDSLGISTPGCIEERCAAVLRDPAAFAERCIEQLGLPCVVKINNQGSSRNVDIVKDRRGLERALGEIAGAGELLLVEEFISGKEVTCAVIDIPGEEKSIALPPTELAPKSSAWFDYHAKYTPGATDEITPARISDEETAEVQRIALACHSALRCGGMSRTDMIISGGRIYVFEINTIPGLTATSLIPQAAQAVGISFPRLLEIQVLWALEQRR